VSDVTWVVCLKCGSKYDTRPLERKQILACPMCKEPGLRYLDAKGNATDDTFPREEAG
jgi:NAD-dependent SIR2 family protein deacetylase